MSTTIHPAKLSLKEMVLWTLYIKIGLFTVDDYWNFSKIVMVTSRHFQWKKQIELFDPNNLNKLKASLFNGKTLVKIANI